MQQILIQPFAVRLPARIVLLTLVIRDDTALFRVNEKYPARTEPVFSHNVFRRNIKNADLR